MRAWSRFVAAFVLLVVTGCGGDDPASPKGDASVSPAASGPGVGHPIVVDTDLASDDMVALLFLLSSNEVDVRAVTVFGTGEVRCPRGLEVARGLLAVTGHDEVPVACGRSTPLAGHHAFPVEWRDAADAAWGVELPDVEVPDDLPSAADLLVETLSTGRVSLLTLGPLTNPADAFRADPDLADWVWSVVIMGPWMSAATCTPRGRSPRAPSGTSTSTLSRPGHRRRPRRVKRFVTTAHTSESTPSSPRLAVGIDEAA